MRRIDRENNFGVDRSEFVQIQTPQVFRVSELKKCIKVKNNPITNAFNAQSGTYM